MTTTKRACRWVGRAVLWTGIVLAALMVASATSPAVAHPPTNTQLAVAVAFVLGCTAVLSSLLLAVGRGARRN